MKNILFIVIVGLVILLQPSSAFSSPTTQSSDITQEEADDLNAKLNKAHELMEPYIFISDKKHKKAKKKKLEQAIKLYDEVLVLVPDHWVSMFFKGKAYQALGDHENAYQSFKRAFHQQVENKDVLNEYALEAMELGYFEEALETLEEGQNKYQTDLGVRGNYALALIMNNRIDDGLKVLHQVQDIWPNDGITKSIIVIAEKIHSGEATLPSTVSGLYKIK